MDEESPHAPASSASHRPASSSREGEHGGEGVGKGEGRSIVVILVGAPGSGKSTFCEDVMRAAKRPWARVCQDSIANGKAGTKAQCLKAAASALKEGKNVFIDRCNLEHEQRSEFVKLGGMQADIHAVVLDLPAKLCISRSVKRSGHEGNLQGGKAAAVVNRMLQKKELPKLSEGFSRITFCHNEADVKDAVTAYCNLGPFDNLPSGYFGKKSADTKVQVGIMKFLKRVDPPSNTTPNGSSPGDVGSESLPLPKDKNDVDSMEVEKEVFESERSEPNTGDSPWKDLPTLAFPSISTSDFQFDIERASDVIVERVADFLNKNKNKNLRLVLVDLSKKSRILSLVKAKAASQSIDSKRFCTFVGDITRLSSGGNLQCQVIANAANWRLKPGGGGVNAAIFGAAGEILVTATKEHAGTLSPGNAVAVPLSPASPLYKKEGVTHVIHVLGPNMNPRRPDCLNGDYEKGCQILRNAYSSLFEIFASIVKSQGITCSEKSPDRNSCGDQIMKRDGTGATGNHNKKNKGNTNSPQRDVDFGSNPGRLAGPALLTNTNHNEESMCSDKESEKDNPELKKTWGSWSQALHRMAMNPEQHNSTLLEIEDNYVVLNDAYPKAKKHLLVLSRVDGLDSLSDVRKEHLPVLQEMHAAGIRWAEKFLSEDRMLIFRLGFHSVPSMRQLHLHVISQDFDSPHLKNKKHWNSFTTAFFRDSVDTIEEINASGKARVNNESMLSMELRCHRCRSAHPNIPRLKSHITKCRTPFPEHLLQKGRLVGLGER